MPSAAANTSTAPGSHTKDVLSALFRHNPTYLDRIHHAFDSLVDLSPANPHLFAKSVLYISETKHYHLIAWPSNLLSPGVRISWSPSTVDAELLPYFLNEDDAFDWHSAVMSACAVLSVDYTKAKLAADMAFRSANKAKFRGIGGMLVTNLNAADSLLQHVVAPLWSAYLAILNRHQQAHDLASESNDMMTSTHDVPPHPPAQLSADELQWVGYRQGLLALALHSNPGLPPACLPPSPEFPLWTDETPTPRRARSMATAMRSPRFKYIETLFVQALRGVSVPRPPVWLHRQAGRYLPEYLQVKGTKNFLEMTADPALASEITMQPVWRYNVDCAIIFSDIMTIPQALGMDLLMQPGPVFPHPIRSLEDIEKLEYNPPILQHVYDALSLTRAQLASDKALVGFCGAPWTLMAYMVGKEIAKKWLHMHPDWSHLLLRKCTHVAIDYLCKQVDAGADVVQVFESNAVDLGPLDFKEFSLPYLKEIAAGVKARHPHVPMTVFPRGANYATKQIADMTLYDAISVDWAATPSEQRIAVGPYVTLQGNLEPDVMYEDAEKIREKVRTMIHAFGKHRYIVNLGHGTKLDMSVDAVGAFVEEAQTIVLGTRNSPLAMAQAKIVQEALESAQLPAAGPTPVQAFAPQPQHRYRAKGVATKGDKILDVALAKIGDKGLFTKELEVALLAGHVALVQHSLKDLETTMVKHVALGAVMKREDKRDALLSLKGKKYTLKTLPHKAVVGTSSLRRRAQIAALRPDLDIVDIRGNLNTRIRKLVAEPKQYDAIVLAVAGLVRLPNKTEIEAQVHVEPIDSTVVVPAVSQGAIGIQVRSSDYGMVRLVSTVEDHETRVVCDEERTFMREIEGGCQVPVGANAAAVDGERVVICGHVWSVDGAQHLSATGSSGAEVAEKLVGMGARLILDAIRM